MRVMVTGGTGFVGAWTVRALLDDSHDVCLLVRDPSKLASVLGPLGASGVDHVKGDMRDGAAVAAAMRGCDAVIHAAAVVSLRAKDAQAVYDANVGGARTVLGRAVEQGMRRILHVSSISAILDPHAEKLHSGLAVALASTGYSRSKSAAERYARELQAAGAPVVISYPGGVFGPHAGPAFGASVPALAQPLKTGIMPFSGGAYNVIDARDLGRIHALMMVPDLPTNRVVAAGPLITVREVTSILRELTGRRILMLPLPGMLLRGIGRTIDMVRQQWDFETPMTYEAAFLMTRMVPSDDSDLASLGMTLRPTAETFRDLILGLVDGGLLQAKHVGRLG